MTDQKYKRTKKLQKAIKLNLKRRTVIVDDKLVFHNNLTFLTFVLHIDFEIYLD